MKLLFISLLSLSAAFAQSQLGLFITHPERNITYKRGGSLLIKWNQQNITPGLFVTDISLRNGTAANLGFVVQNFLKAPIPADSLHYEWQIPMDIHPDANYAISIKDSKNADAYSNRFSIA
ncbi:hypothetical protein BDB01DRAFT_855306 [Pilobolus umbonatus]|nr:hypothetical protein BDB01DRAFT_855306 [Pilobolus umbonatus]